MNIGQMDNLDALEGRWKMVEVNPVKSNLDLFFLTGTEGWRL